MPELKVLIVDDEENNRTVLCDALGGEPFELLEAGDGKQALDIANREKPDLILLDVMMPGIDGMTVLNTLKRQESTRNIPIMMVTALNMDSQISMFLDAGAMDHIVKPFSGLVVRARVRAALRARVPAAGGETQGPKTGKVLGFIGAKGGTGTTTVAVNVALGLAEQKRSVVLVEIRPCMGTVAQQLGAPAALNLEPLLGSDEKGAINLRTVSKCFTPHPSGLKLLLAPPTYLHDREFTSQQAEDILKVLSGMADYVIADFPFLSTKTNRTALRCCNFVAVTFEPEATCLASSQAMLKGLESAGVGGRTVGAVLVHHGVTDSSITMGHVRSNLNCRIIGMIPPAVDLCRAALKNGQPLIVSHPESVAGVALKELSSRLMADPVPAVTF